MSLGERLAAVEAEEELKKVCPVARVIAQMDETERAAYEGLVKLVRSYQRLSDILRDEGYPNDKRNLQNHLTEKCRCYAT